MNNRQKGIFNRNKTKKWLEKQGYMVSVSEVNKICYFNGRFMAVHKDLFGSDLLAMNGKDIIFVQCKTGKKNVAVAEKEFAKYPFPSFVQRWIVVWEKRVRNPIICKVNNS